MARGTMLDGDNEKALARRIIEAEDRAYAAIARVPGLSEILERPSKGSERTRAGRIDRLGEAVTRVADLARADPTLVTSSRTARRAWREAEALRWQLAMSGRRIAQGEARKLKATQMDQADLTQEGYVGLLRAAKRFDPDRDIRFATYARWWVRAQMTRAIDHHGRMVRLPGGAVEQLRNLRKAMAEMEGAGQPWTVADLAAQAGVDIDRAEFLLSRRRAISLDEPLDDDGARSVADRLAGDTMDPEAASAHAEELARMHHAVKRFLDPRQRSVVVQRYGLEDGRPTSLSQIARGMSLSRERVRQIERQALQILQSRGKIRDASGIAA